MRRQEGQIGHQREIGFVDHRLLVGDGLCDRLVQQLWNSSQKRQTKATDNLLRIANRAVDLFQCQHHARSDETTEQKGNGQVERQVGADRKSVVEGKRVAVRGDLGGRRIIKKKKAQRVDEARQNTRNK